MNNNQGNFGQPSSSGGGFAASAGSAFSTQVGSAFGGAPVGSAFS
jgi:hypothetical protein